MPFVETGIKDLWVFEPKVIDDNRGHFFEAYSAKSFEAAGLDYQFVQDNQSFSTYGVIRGLHYQLSPFGQAKLVRVLQGTILDVAVDLRAGSPTFGQVYEIELSAENKKQLLIPVGFAHGFSVLSQTAGVLYKCDQFYHKESEAGIHFSDPKLNIDWRIPANHQKISEKDLLLPFFDKAMYNFSYR